MRQPYKPPFTRISAHVDPELAARLKADANRERRSMAQHIGAIIAAAYESADEKKSA